MTLILVGILLLVALPRVHGLLDSLAVDRAARQIAAAHSRARIAAVLQSRVLELTVGATALRITTKDGSGTLWSAAGPDDEGVALAGPSRTLTFSPTGITLGLSNASFLLSRGAARRTVVVSRLGRVRITP